MFRNLTQRFHDLLADVHDSLTATALEPRLMPMPKTMPMTMPIPMTMPSLQGPAAQRGVRSSASTPSLRSRDGTVPNHARLDAGGNVRVVVRVRAFLPREIARSAQCLIRMDPLSQRTTLVAPGDGDADPANARARARKATVEDKSFTFDNSFWSHDTDDEHYATQEDVYDSLGEEFLDHNFEGYHTCIFAYGQTGSGKSYSMMGTADQPGLIPRTCQDLFERIAAAHDETPNISYNVRVSYFEVYNEHVRDLLAAPPAPSQAPYYLKIRESPTEGPYVKDLTDVPVRSLDEILRHMRKGDQSRTTASTKMNDTSSRSHAVFTIMLKQIHHDLDTDETTERSSRIRLVDLAGSERAKSTEATGQRLREGSNINRSLTTLGRVIAALADPKKTPSKKGPGSSSVVPYRDSILTWLLKDSLGGNSKTAMIACIAPSDYDETLSTLRYADQAKRIRTRAVVNQDSISTAERDAQIAAMADEIRALQLVVGDSRRREKDAREAEERLEDYQARVRGLQQLMDERSLVAEGKIRSLQTENEALRLHLKLALESLKNPIPVVTVREVDDGVAPNAGVEEEDGDDDVTATKKQIYRDRMLLSPKRQHHQTPDEDKENHTPKGHRHSLHHLSPDKDQDQDDGYASGGDNSDYTDTEEAPNHYEAGADDMHEQMQVLLRDLDMFRRKIGDDKSRFFLAAAADPKSLKPHHQSGNTGSGNKESLTAAAAVAISGGALARRRNPLGERSNII
ncbi:P-loop containing nucleoside triphosphate hydrolase protein [Lasiosphaeria miniovina]|uniref:Kinesin-like protein n=1 Tax=Lasiosphaeria miniovina TaxID=1954250 RepID=A0AA40B5P1_9PEZI|nr:P-loop containing nucleoside triphosphate hydrolase protein [Lasiosphaeria miniovina]KAK0728094.1 P-loop containing nucleoside triphosphate hydrolase protein [Lasiosphaeria miniovina]